MDILYMDVQNFAWSVFACVIIILLIFDLGVLNKKDEIITFKKSAYLSLFYIAISCLFGLFVFREFGSESASEYYTGFLLEKTMSLDNIFMISMIFRFFKIPQQYQHRVLFWGILGVIVLRAIMIYVGAALLEQFSWILFILAAVLIVTGIKTLYMLDKPPTKISDMFIFKWVSSHLNLHPELVGNKFTIRKNGKLFFTPLFMALVTIESMDLIFAIDSIPAIFAVTQNSFIVYSSNIFAILGLRALFFCLEDIVERFKYIKYSLAIILILIGVKILVAHFIPIPKLIPLLLTIVLILIGIVVSIIKAK
ncbi:MAG: TerC/Alx family metal homeostasis membrane protein [Alphaproteobacteria bacterium]|nr:TerC/Alx family metal homeostasis membrane protein [Alphaproteobacteria bacterium]